MARSRYPIGDIITTRVWEYLKRTLRRDPTKLRKKDINKMLTERQTPLDEIISKKRGKRGISLKQAKKEKIAMKRLGMTKEAMKKGKGVWSRKVGVYSKMKKLNLFEQSVRKGSNKTYVRGYVKWSKEEKETLMRNQNMPTRQLKSLLEAKHKRAFTYSSVATMKSRLKKRNS